MAKQSVAAGALSLSVYVFIRDTSSSTGAGLTGLAYNTSGLSAYYVRTRGSATAITLATLAAANSSYSSGGFKEVDATNLPGVYRLDVPDAAIARGARGVVVMLKGAANMEPTPLELDLQAEVTAESIYRGSVTGASPTSTTLVDSGLTQSDTDHWRGRTLIFTSGALKYQATDITAFTPASDTLTFTALTAAPAQNDEFVIV